MHYLEAKEIKCKFTIKKEFKMCCASFMQSGDREVIICAVYRFPPAGFQEFMDYLERALGALCADSHHSLIIAGDFNPELRPELSSRDGEMRCLSCTLCHRRSHIC